MRRIRLPAVMVEHYFEGLDERVSELRNAISEVFELAQGLTDDWEGYNFDPHLADTLRDELAGATTTLEDMESSQGGDYIDVWVNE